MKTQASKPKSNCVFNFDSNYLEKNKG